MATRWTPWNISPPLDSPKNLMLKARKKRDYNSEKGKEYAALAAYLGTEPSVLKHYVY